MKRLDAAANALAYAPAYRDGTNGEYWRSKARAILAAADAVTFSDQAVHRVAVYLGAIKFPGSEWGELKTSTTDTLLECARVLVDDLKNGDE